MCVVIPAKILRPSSSVSSTDRKLNAVCSCFCRLKSLYYICPLHNMSLKAALKRPVNFIGKSMLFLQLGYLHVLGPFCVLDNLTVPLLIETSFIDWFFKAETNSHTPLDSIKLTTLFRAAKSVAIPPSEDLSILDTTSSVWMIQMAQHTTLKQNKMMLPTSGILMTCN